MVFTTQPLYERMTLDEAKERVLNYFTDRPTPTYNGLSLALGVTLRTMEYYLAGEREAPEEWIDLLTWAFALMDEKREEEMYTSRNCTGALFALKNRGRGLWRDVQEVNTTHKLDDNALLALFHQLPVNTLPNKQTIEGELLAVEDISDKDTSEKT